MNYLALRPDADDWGITKSLLESVNGLSQFSIGVIHRGHLILLVNVERNLQHVLKHRAHAPSNSVEKIAKALRVPGEAAKRIWLKSFSALDRSFMCCATEIKY